MIAAVPFDDTRKKKERKRERERERETRASRNECSSSSTNTNTNTKAQIIILSASCWWTQRKKIPVKSPRFSLSFSNKSIS